MVGIYVQRANSHVVTAGYIVYEMHMNRLPTHEALTID